MADIVLGNNEYLFRSSDARFDYDAENKIFEENKELVDKVNTMLNNIVDFKQYINNNGVVDRKFIDQIDGHFKYKALDDVHEEFFYDEADIHGHVPGEIEIVTYQKANIKFTMRNAITEIYVGLVLAKGRNLRAEDYSATYLDGKNLFNYTLVTTTHNPMICAYLKNIRFLNAPKRRLPGRGRRAVVAVQNPLTERFISVTGNIYKRYYDKLILRNGTYRDLISGTDEYEIKKNCVSSLIEHIFDKMTAIKFIPKDPTYHDIIKVMRHKQVDCSIYDDLNKLLTSVKYDNSEYDPINIRIYDDHVYLVGGKKKRGNAETGLKNFSDIKSYKDTKFIIRTEKRFNEFINFLKSTYIIDGRGEYKITYKTNEIHYVPEYDKILQLREVHNIKNKSITNVKMIMSTYLGLKGFMNQETYDEFYKEISNNILYYRKYSDPNIFTIALDSNGAYNAQMYNMSFPKPSLNDYPEEYDGKPTTRRGFYKCEIEGTIFFKPLLWVYYKYVNELKKRGYLKKITQQLLVNDIIEIDTDYLPDISGDITKNKPTAFTKKEIREYIGCLILTHRDTDTIYYDVKAHVLRALLDKHHSLSYETDMKIEDKLNGLQMEDFIDDKKSYKIVEHKTYKRMTTGLLGWIVIAQSNNFKLLLLDEEIKRLNKDCILAKITTDCLSYVFKDNKYKLPEDMMSKIEYGKFKVEKTANIYINKKYNIDKHDIIKDAKNCDIVHKNSIKDYIKILPSKIRNYTKGDIPNLLKEEESIKLEGMGGVGKTYLLINTIIPYLKKHKMKYILCSTTIAQANDLMKKTGEHVHTIQMLFHKDKSYRDYKNEFDDIHYIIIDEIVQIRQMNAKHLEYVKKTFNVSLICLSDKYQCTTEKIKGLPIINTKFGDRLFDRNIIQLGKHKYMRYEEALYNHLMYIINNWDDVDKIRRYVKKHFNIVTKSKTIINISYLNDTRIENWGNSKCKCESAKHCKDVGMHNVTVHCIQGFTLEVDYTFHDLMKAPADVIYTALSRAKLVNQIFVCIPE
jgi:hypothetical protein